MDLTHRTLLTVICEAALEHTLQDELDALGASGYTITDARGKGTHGRREASWAPHANIRLETLCDRDTALAICQRLRERYYDNYSMVLYLSDVEVLRPAKFGP